MRENLKGTCLCPVFLCDGEEVMEESRFKKQEDSLGELDNLLLLVSVALGPHLSSTKAK